MSELVTALNRAYFYLQFRARTRWEMEQYLTKKAIHYGWKKETVDEALDSLREEGLVNDVSFIELYVEDRNRNKPKTEFVLQQELMRKGVDKELIHSYFSEHPQDQEPLAVQALQSKIRQWQHLPAEERFQKATAFLGRRGFSYTTIKKAVAQLKETK
ncbi:hypothetical protein HGA88_04785 [Candidatus Roizmanbacteria bacterium]|nr:hypothetical protein [Candidatus Roizmanbacteria bacterium]